MIEREPIAVGRDRKSGRRIGKLLHRKTIGAFAGFQPRVEVAAEDAWNAGRELGEEGAHLALARAVGRQHAAPPAHAVLQVHGRDEQPLPVHLGERGDGRPALALAGQLDRADIDQRSRGEHGVAVFGAGARTRRREERRESPPTRQIKDVAIHLLQQQDEVGNRRSSRQARASEIVDELREVAPAVMQVPRDDGKNRTVRDNDRRNADRGARAREGQRGDENDAG